MRVKGTQNEVSSRVFKVIGVAHAMLKVQQPKLQNATVIRQAMFNEGV
jgi:hypothetical protein